MDYHPFDHQIHGARRSDNRVRDDPPHRLRRVWGLGNESPPCPDAFDTTSGRMRRWCAIPSGQARLRRDMGFRATSIPVPIPKNGTGCRDLFRGASCASRAETRAQARIERVRNVGGVAVGFPYSHRRTLTTSAGARG